MATKEDFIQSLGIVRKQEDDRKEKINFNQTVDLIINLREFDVTKTPINIFVNLPHKIRDKKVAGFLEKKSDLLDTITKPEFDNFKDKKKSKELVRSYDFFIAGAKLMPLIATTFGRVLGPAGKMPSPQLGVLMTEDDNSIKNLLQKVQNVIKIRAKEPSIKIAIGKQSDKDENIAENAALAFSEVFKLLPRNKENLRNVLIKFTMGKPVKVKI